MDSTLVISAAVGAVVGAGAVLLLRPSKRLTIWGVIVSPTPPHLSNDPLSISRGDTVQWTPSPSVPPKVPIIEFDQKIFTNVAQQGNGKYRVIWNGSSCDSGAIVSNPPAPPSSAGYPYSEGLANSPTGPPQPGPAGHIIIRP